MSDKPIGITEHGDMVYPWSSEPPRVEDAIADHVDNPNAQRVEDSHAKLAAEMRGAPAVSG